MRAWRGRGPNGAAERAGCGARRFKRPTASVLSLTAGLIVSFTIAGAEPPPARFDPAGSDAAAVALASQTLEAMGGREGWDATRYIHFSFDVIKGGTTIAHRVHLWDRFSGRLRFEKADKDGTPIVVLLDVNSRAGSAWRGGVRLEAGAARPWLDEAYESWINDTYWLLMPYKMTDPGVHLRSAGSQTIADATYDRVLLSFDHVGLTPGDRYWASINRTTHRMDRWAYILEDEARDKTPAAWTWTGWTRHGRILLSPEKVSVSEPDLRIVHPILEVADDLPAAYFETPAAVPDHLTQAR